MQNAVVLGLEVADGMVSLKTTFKQLEKRFNSVYMIGIRFLSEHLDLLEHRATTSAGKPVSILRVKGEKNLALPSSVLVVCRCIFLVLV